MLIITIFSVSFFSMNSISSWKFLTFFSNESNSFRVSNKNVFAGLKTKAVIIFIYDEMEKKNSAYIWYLMSILMVPFPCGLLSKSAIIFRLSSKFSSLLLRSLNTDWQFKSRWVFGCFINKLNLKMKVFT